MAGKNKGGRPPVEIDWDEFDKLCLIQCTLSEIASWFNCSEDTIERHVKKEKEIGFAEYFQQKKGIGKMSLRRKMYQSAMKDGNTTMQIWLSKQYLGFADKKESDVNVNIKSWNDLEKEMEGE